MDFQQMQRNLATMIRQIDCSLDQPYSEDVKEDPVDPFHKKIFEKRMRRSSVASDYGDDRATQNLGSNMEKLRLSNYCRPVIEAQNQYKSQCPQQQYEPEVENMFNLIMDSLLQTKMSSIQHLNELSRQQEREKKGIYHSRSQQSYENEKKQFLENLKAKMNFICQYLTQKNIQNPSFGRNSVKYMDTYECQTQGSAAFKQNQEENQNTNYWSEQNNSSIGNITYKNKKQKKGKQSRIQAGSRVGAPKSVYESVLQERRQRNKKKRSRVI